MGKTRGSYKEEFPVGTKVKIADRQALENFIQQWKYHNPLQTEQLDYAGKIAIVKKVGFYHGGDELYILHNIPGIWHEENLLAL